MPGGMDFVLNSLDLHLFFARIMKEHSFFLQTSFTSRDQNFIQQADAFRRQFDGLLAEVISLSNGVASPAVLHSGEVFTPYTLDAERLTAYYTGVHIPTGLTQAEAGLAGGMQIDGAQVRPNPVLESAVFRLNQKAISLIASLIEFKSRILSDVLSCRMFTGSYPLLIDHIMREARLYLRMVQRLQNGEHTDMEREALEQEMFWNRIMAEHSKFIRGLLDPTENDLINTADNFGKEFDRLTAEAKAAMDKTIPLSKVTDDSMKAATAIRDFKAQGTQGLLQCKVKSIIIPLLGDHTLREANHYLRLLRLFKR